ncbi:hypothetical protein ASH00_04605 [Arthrobacter sp. Soil782]|uniref:hypothetical protein n=1 Tax=Arthrobacter sp. Soil782 TaxID=1736410 RepID=UPI0006F8B8B0|nr:hypothetical protein [Arthrobacter sp. Soil782]KRF08962.1 hypothetical protein ASH00_04605 [Arthrobacter sp. Soil782]
MNLEIGVAESVWIALGLTLVLTALHLAAPRIRRLPFIPERFTASFAGGIATAYVFLHLLPELAAGNEAVGETLQDVLDPTPLLELVIFFVALSGFIVFYGLERLASRSSAAGSKNEAGMYWLHLASFMVYNILITYTLALRVRTGLLFALLFTIAMGLHFVLTDRGLRERYAHRFDRTGRLLLAGALIAGWIVGSIAAPTSTLLVALLTAFLGGSILLNVFREEIPPERNSSFGWFCIGLVFYGGLLTLITAIQG